MRDETQNCRLLQIVTFLSENVTLHGRRKCANKYIDVLHQTWYKTIIYSVYEYKAYSQTLISYAICCFESFLMGDSL